MQITLEIQQNLLARKCSIITFRTFKHINKRRLLLSELNLQQSLTKVTTRLKKYTDKHVTEYINENITQMDMNVENGVLNLIQGVTGSGSINNNGNPNYSLTPSQVIQIYNEVKQESEG